MPVDTISDPLEKNVPAHSAGTVSSTADLTAVRRIGRVVFAGQFLFLCWWSNLLVSRQLLTWDFAIYHQSLNLISHGDLNPFSTIHGIHFWQDHSAFVMWPIAFVWRIWPHDVSLLWIQDAATVAVEYVAFAWACDFLERMRVDRRPQIPRSVLAFSAVVLFVLNPWILYSVSFDFHVEAFATLFIVLAARDFYHERRRKWIWIGLALLSGDIGATYVAGLGLSLLFVGRRRWKEAATLLGLGVAYTLFISAIHGTIGSGLGGYREFLSASQQRNSASLKASTLLIAIASRPWKLLTVIWQRRISVFANMSPSGLVGIATGWTVGVPLVVLVENGLKANNANSFLDSNTTFQNLGAYAFITLGTVLIIAGLAVRERRWLRVASIGLLSIVLLNVVGWAIVWFPQVDARFVAVTSPAAATEVTAIAQRIPVGQEVIASQGFIGALSGRRWAYPIEGAYGKVFPLVTKTVWFVIAPQQGIELAPVNASVASLGEIASLPGATLVAERAGIWEFRWHPPPAVRSITLAQNPYVPIPAWATPGPAGLSVRNGPGITWSAEANGKEGYVVSGDYWTLADGSYRAAATLSISSPMAIEVWDDTTGRLLARESVAATNRPETVELDFSLSHVQGQATKSFTGSLLWRNVAHEPARFGDELEVRVFSAAGGLGSVQQVDIQPVR